MASLSVDDCIRAMFEKHVLWKPRQYQVDAIRDICADDKHTLVVKGTGQGKTCHSDERFIAKFPLPVPADRRPAVAHVERVAEIEACKSEIMGSLRLSADARRQLLRKLQIKWHPDNFPGDDAASVEAREFAGVVARLANEAATKAKEEASRAESQARRRATGRTGSSATRPRRPAAAEPDLPEAVRTGSGVFSAAVVNASRPRAVAALPPAAARVKSSAAATTSCSRARAAARASLCAPTHRTRWITTSATTTQTPPRPCLTVGASAPTQTL